MFNGEPGVHVNEDITQALRHQGKRIASMTTQVFDAAHARYLGEQRHGVLTTIAASGFPQTKPVGFRYDPQRGTIEVSGYDMEHSAKFRNVAANPLVAFTISDVPNQDAGSAGVRFMEVRGVAEQARLDEPMIAGISPWIIRIHPQRLVSYNVAGSGGHAIDLAGEAAAPQRPAAGLTAPPRTGRARRSRPRSPSCRPAWPTATRKPTTAVSLTT
jgi:pyridoxamine 5'-phosphate oxidase family protein